MSRQECTQLADVSSTGSGRASADATRQPSHHALRSAVRLVTAALRPADPAAVREAIEQALRVLGSRGCAAWVAQAYGDFPEAAVTRMHWAQKLVAETFADDSNYWEPPAY